MRELDFAKRKTEGENFDYPFVSLTLNTSPDKGRQNVNQSAV